MSTTSKIYPPSPKGFWPLGNTLGFEKDPLSFFAKHYEKSGDILSFNFFKYKFYFLNNPDYIRHLMVTNAGNYIKSTSYEPLRIFSERGLFSSEGKLWLSQRKRYAPAFHQQQVSNYSKTMAKFSKKLLEEWRQKAERKEVLDSKREMVNVTLNIVGETLLGSHIPEDGREDLGRLNLYAMWKVLDRIKSHPYNAPFWWPLPSHIKARKRLKEANVIVQKMIDDRVLSGKRNDDLLDFILDLAKESDFEEQEAKDIIVEEARTITMAGHDTSANILNWFWYRMCKHPDIQEKIYEEVSEKIGDHEPSIETLYSLTYTIATVKEVLRHYPPVWIIGKQALDDDQFGDFHVPKGIDVVFSTYIFHRHPELWDNPNDFNPDRFLNVAEETYANHFVPFGIGPRKCIGYHFAWLEMLHILVPILRNFKVNFAEPHSGQYGQFITLQPKQAIKLVLSNRK